MVFYKVQTLAAPVNVREFDNAEDAIRAAMSYDHEYEVLMSDSQDPTDSDVRFAYIWLNKIHLGSTASSDFIQAARNVAKTWPYSIA